MIPNLIQESLAEILGSQYILSSPADLDRYSCDALTPSRAFYAEDAFTRLADLVVKPGSTAEICKILHWAQESQITVIPYGGGTGVMGSVLPVNGGIILDLARLNNIVDVNVLDMTATVESGVILGDLETHLNGLGMMHGHDPYSVPIATVGGTISTNGVGYRAGAHGPMGDQVVSLEIVLPDGRKISTRSVPKYSSGPNLNHLFIGTEGVFGIITKATIKMYRLPESQRFATMEFDSFAHGFNAATELHAIGIRPTLLDLTQENNETRLFLMFEGFEEGVAAQETRTKEICKAFGGRDIGSEPTLQYWSTRRDSAENYKINALGKSRKIRWERQRGRGFDYLHLALPVSKVLDYKRKAEQILLSHKLKVIEYAIWSRPEFFSMMIIPENPDDLEARDLLADGIENVLTLAQDMGGIMEYCHGVGIKLNHLLSREMGINHDIIHTWKDILDPANILNPGKLGLPSRN